MALDVQVLKNPGETRAYKVEAAATNILPGDPVKVGGTGNNYVIPLATGDPEVGTDEFVGIAVSTSSETASADGEVLVQTIIPGQTVLRAKATTATNIDTAAELLGVLGDWVTFDLAGGTFTIDENEGTDPNVHGLKIVDGDTGEGTLDVIVHAGASEGAPLTGQTMD